MKITVDSLTKQLRIYAFAVKNLTKKALAEQAGVAEICLRNIHEEEWNPTLNTLRALEKIIPPDWCWSEEPLFQKSRATHTIYIIRCSVNNSIYVGESVDFDARGTEHFKDLRKGTHKNKKMQKDFLEFGENSFVIVPLFNIEQGEDAERKLISLLSIFTTIYNANKKPKGV